MLLAERQQSWPERRRAGPIHPSMRFTGDRLELGAGTVLARMAEVDGNTRAFDIEGGETRILALLTAAYRRPVSPQVLCNIRRAGREWVRGEACLAHIHLAFTGLPKLDAVEDAAYRLFMADGLIEAGISPRDIVRALDLDPAPIDSFEKDYNAAEPRMPGGFGTVSGEWTTGEAAEALVGARLAPEAVVALGVFAAGVVVGSPTARAILGHIFLPEPAMPGPVEGAIPGKPDLTYRWNTDEGSLVLAHNIGGQSVPFKEAHIGLDGIYRDSARMPIAREAGGQLIIDSAVLTQTSPAPEQNPGPPTIRAVPLPLRPDTDEEPKLCPMPTPDKPGRLGTKEKWSQYKKDRDYEDYRKAMVNQDFPTPSGFGVKLPSGIPGKQPVHYDDCQRQTDTLFEYKGTGYAAMLAKADPPPGRKPDIVPKRFLTEQWLAQARRQVRASGGRPIEWDFAEKAACDYAQKIFGDDPKLARIKVEWYPWSEKSK